jgi:hypothetical protein
MSDEKPKEAAPSLASDTQTVWSRVTSEGEPVSSSVVSIKGKEVDKRQRKRLDLPDVEFSTKTSAASTRGLKEPFPEVRSTSTFSPPSAIFKRPLQIEPAPALGQLLDDPVSNPTEETQTAEKDLQEELDITIDPSIVDIDNETQEAARGGLWESTNLIPNTDWQGTTAGKPASSPGASSYVPITPSQETETIITEAKLTREQVLAITTEVQKNLLRAAGITGNTTIIAAIDKRTKLLLDDHSVSFNAAVTSLHTEIVQTERRLSARINAAEEARNVLTNQIIELRNQIAESDKANVIMMHDMIKLVQSTKISPDDDSSEGPPPSVLGRVDARLQAIDAEVRNIPKPVVASGPTTQSEPLSDVAARIRANKLRKQDFM